MPTSPTDDQLHFRRATAADLPALVKMLADDPISAQRESYTLPLPQGYQNAFAAIDRDANNELVVVELQGAIAGMLQITFIPNLTYQGGWRALVEGVHVAAPLRSRGIGRKMFAWAIARARERGCRLVQLTSDKRRTEAIRFYKSLGFVDSHEGFKLVLK